MAVAMLAAVAWAAQADAQQRLRVTDLKPLLARAVDHGEARGVLVGEAAQWIGQQFRSAAPIEIDVTTVQRLSRAGCARLAITTTQDRVWDYNRQRRASAPERQSFTWQVNYCRDGSLPGLEAIK